MNNALKNVEVGWKVERVCDDAFLFRLERQCGGGELEQVDRGLISYNHLTLRRAEQGRDLVPNPSGRVPPALVPAANQVCAPFLFHSFFHAVNHESRQSPQRVSIKVDETWIIHDELLAIGCKWILLIKLSCKFT